MILLGGVQLIWERVEEPGGPGGYRDDGFSSERQSYLHISWLRIKTSVQLLGVAAWKPLCFLVASERTELCTMAPAPLAASQENNRLIFETRNYPLLGD